MIAILDFRSVGSLSAVPRTPLDLVARLAGPLDRARGWALRALGPVGRTLVVQREQRVAVLGVVAVLAALATTLLVPLWALALGPLVLGVPHLVADVRYLVVRPGLHRRPLAWLLVGVPILGSAVLGRVDLALLAVAGALLAARGAGWKRVLGVLVALVVAGLANRAALLAVVLVMHAHNLVAIGLWAGWRRRATRWHWLPLGLFAAGAWLVTTDFAVELVRAAGGLVSFPGAVDARHELRRLAPGLPGAWAIKVLLSFAYAQSVHYGVWLRLVPDEDRARRTPRTFAATFRALRADLGAPLLLGAAALALALAIWGALDVAAARAGYFRLAAFHGPLELAVAAWFWMEGRPRRVEQEERSR